MERLTSRDIFFFLGPHLSVRLVNVIYIVSSHSLCIIHQSPFLGRLSQHIGWGESEKEGML